MSLEIQCSACRGRGNVVLPIHLLAILNDLRKNGPSTAAQVALRFTKAGIGHTGFCNRLAQLFGYGFVTRERSAKEWIYSAAATEEAQS